MADAETDNSSKKQQTVKASRVKASRMLTRRQSHKTVRDQIIVPPADRAPTATRPAPNDDVDVDVFDLDAEQAHRRELAHAVTPS